MTARFDVDLETDRIHFDGSWLTREDLSGRIQSMLAAGDFKISRHSEALEHLAQTIAGARSLTVKLSAEQYAKLEAAGQKLGKPAHAFARDLLLQVLSGGTPNVVAVTPAPAPAPVIAAPAQTGDHAEEATPLTITPKRKDPLPGAPVASPPVMTPVATPSLNLPGDGAKDDGAKGKAGAPGDGRRWFNRS